MNRLYLVVFLALLSVVLVSGCVTDWFGQDVLKINDKTVEVGFKDILEINTVRTEPSSPLLPDMKTTLMFIIKNKDELKSATIVKTQLLDAVNFNEPTTGIECNIPPAPGQERCKPSLGLCSSDSPCNVLPGEEKLIEYDLQAPSIEDIANVRQESELQFKVNYDFKASMIYDAVIINMDEVKRRQRAGETLNIDRRTVMGSGPVQIDIQLYNNPYILAGQEAVFIFKVKNLGDKTKGTLKDSKIPAGKMKITFPQGLITNTSEISTPTASRSKDAPVTGELVATGMVATPPNRNLYIEITFKDGIVPETPIQYKLYNGFWFVFWHWESNPFQEEQLKKEGSLKGMYTIPNVKNNLRIKLVLSANDCKPVEITEANNPEIGTVDIGWLIENNYILTVNMDCTASAPPPSAGTPAPSGTGTPPGGILTPLGTGTSAPAEGKNYFADPKCTDVCKANKISGEALCVDITVMGLGKATCLGHVDADSECNAKSPIENPNIFHCCCGVTLPTTGSEAAVQPLFNCTLVGNDMICTNLLDIELYAGESMPLYFRVSNTGKIEGSPYKTFIVIAEADYAYELRSVMSVVVNPYGN